MSIHHSYKDIDYTLKRSDRKTTSIYIERDGTVLVLAPAPFDHQRIESILEKKRRWIYRGLAEWQDLNRTQVHREYVNGESFLYLGRHYQLQIVDDQQAPLLLKQGQFRLRRAEIKQADKHFKAFYKTRLLKRLHQNAPLFEAKMGKQATGFKVLELKNRWASCTASGTINVHWKCAMLPSQVLDYVLVHELAHLHHPSHNPAFWRTVEKVLLNYEEQKAWLKFNGAGMSL